VSAYEGLIIRHKVGGCAVVEHAPDKTRMTLELLTRLNTCACTMNVNRGGIWIGDTAYRVTGWDPEAKSLILERASDLDFA
jgi:hypothetical protein